MAKEWDRVKLRKLIEFTEAGTSVNSEDRMPKDGELGILKTSAVTYGCLDITKQKAVLSSEEHKVSVTLQKDTILISRMNTLAFVGASAYVDRDYENIYLPDRLWPASKKKKAPVDMKWLSYMLASAMIRFRISNIATGTSGSMKNITKPNFLNLEINLPPLSEQRKIAEILSTWDEAIALTGRLIAALQQRKKGLMQRLLTGEVRFPGFEGEWRENNLGKFANVRRGASPRPITNPRYFAEKGRGWIRISDVTGAPTRFLNSTTQYLSQLGESKSVKVEVGDLIMSICATIGVPKIVNIPACIHDGFVLFSEFQNSFKKEFLYHYIGFMTERLANRGQPGTQKNLNTEIVRKFKVPCISLDEQEQIISVLNCCDEEIELSSRKLEVLNQQKKGLMQRLLTGEVRVKV